MLSALAHLHSASLVLCEETTDGTEMRFRMLESLREYASSHLSREEHAELRQRHCGWYLDCAEAAVPRFHGRGAEECLMRLGAEEDNFWAALQWTVAAKAEERRQKDEEGSLHPSAFILQPLEIGLRLAAALAPFWVRRGALRQGWETLIALLARQGPIDPQQDPEAAALRARALNAAGLLCTWQGRYREARANYEEARVLSSESCAPAEHNHALFGLASIHQQLGEYAPARSRYEEALALKRACGDTLGFAHGLASLGMNAHVQGDYAAARTAYEEGLSASRALADSCCEALALNQLGLLLGDLRDSSGARSRLHESLEIRQRLGDQAGSGITLQNLGIVEYRLGNATAARTLLRQSLALCREMGNRRGAAASLLGLGLLSRDEGDLSSALASIHESLATRRDLEDRRGLEECLEVLASLAGIGPSAPLCPERAARFLGAAEALREQLSAPPVPAQRAEHEHTRAVLREQMTAEGFARALAEGAALPLEQIINDALTGV